MVAPVIPHLSSLLAASEDAKRLEAVQMLARLFTSPHKERLLADFRDLLGELLLRYKDNKVSGCVFCVAQVGRVGAGACQQEGFRSRGNNKVGVGRLDIVRVWLGSGGVCQQGGQTQCA